MTDPFYVSKESFVVGSRSLSSHNCNLRQPSLCTNQDKKERVTRRQVSQQRGAHFSHLSRTGRRSFPRRLPGRLVEWRQLFDSRVSLGGGRETTAFVVAVPAAVCEELQKRHSLRTLFFALRLRLGRTGQRSSETAFVCITLLFGRGRQLHRQGGRAVGVCVRNFAAELDHSLCGHNCTRPGKSHQRRRKQRPGQNAQLCLLCRPGVCRLERQGSEVQLQQSRVRDELCEAHAGRRGAAFF